MAPPTLTREQSLETAKGRLAAKVVLIPFSDCHYFDGSRNEHGYGSLRIAGKAEKAHRAAYELAFGPIPSGEGYHGTVVRHKCNEPSCVNPDHLELGTQLDNLADTRQRDRDYKGEGHHYRKISDEVALAIRRRLDRGERNKDIAADYEGVTPNRVGVIKYRDEFRWLARRAS